MSLILSGTDGLSDVDGSAATPAIRGTDANTGIFFPAADTIAFAEGGVESMRIDSSGNLGLGVTPSAWGGTFRTLQLPGGSSISGTTDPTLQITQNGFYNGTNWIYSTTAPVSNYYQASGQHIWRTAPSGTAGNAITFTQAMTLTAAGNLGIGNTSPENPLDVQRDSTTAYSATTDQRNQAKIIARNASESAGYFSSMSLVTGGGNQAEWSLNNVYSSAYSGSLAFKYRNGGSSWAEAARFDTSGKLLIGSTTNTTNSNLILTGATRWAVGTQAGGNLFYIVRDSDGVGQYMVNGSTSWTATSDERLKDIIEPITNASSKVSTLRAVIGKFKKDEEGTRRSFLIAQDVQAVLPEAVTVQEDEFGTLGVQYTEVIPLLVAAIQEQQALITTLTERITALEAK